LNWSSPRCDGSDNLLLINWIISSEATPREAATRAPASHAISAGYLPFNQCHTVVDSDGELRHFLNLSEGRVIDRWDTTQAGAISEVDQVSVSIVPHRMSPSGRKRNHSVAFGGGAAINRVDDVLARAHTCV
jgi:hypothetical protein